jgi:tetratricopeptide (TPR) repeat protein
VDLLKKRAYLLRLEARRLSEALSDLDRAAQLDPNDLEIVLQRGLTLSALGRDGEAEAELDDFIGRKADPARVFALLERGRIRARTGRPNPAIADYTAAIAIQPVLELYLARGQLQESLGQLAAAAAGYRDGISRLGRALSLITALVRVETARGRFQAALKQIDDELAQASVKTLWFLRRAYVLDAMGQSAQSQAELERALTEANRVLTRKATAIHLFSRAKVFVALGRPDDAKRDLEMSVRLAPGFAEARNMLQKWE